MTNNNITETVDMPLEMFKDLFVATVEETKEDNVCTFCNHQYLTGKSPEIPVKLHCGHIFGVRCLTRKLVRNKNFNRCSACNLLISVKNEQREEKHTLVEGLKDNSPRQPVDGGPLKGAELLWAEKAEHLWKNMCDDMIRSLQTIDDEDEWGCGSGMVTRRVFKFNTVERFAQELDGLSYSDILQQCSPEAFPALCRHLRGRSGDLEGSSLTPGHATFTWFADSYLLMEQAHERLLARYQAS